MKDYRLTMKEEERGIGEKVLNLWGVKKENMLSRDLFASVIKTFFKELDDVRDGGEQVNDGRLYARFYPSYFGMERDWFVRKSAEEITVFFADDPIHKLELLTELMYLDAFSLTDRDMQRIIFQKILQLYDIIDERSQEYSMARVNRAAGIQDFLNQ